MSLQGDNWGTWGKQDIWVNQGNQGNGSNCGNSGNWGEWVKWGN